MTLSPFMKEVDTLIRARYPLLYLVTYEEQRLDALLGELAESHGKDLLEWSSTKGLRPVGKGKGPRFEDTQSPLAALEAIGTLTRPALVLLKDFHRCLEDPLLVRALRELGYQLKTSFTTAIVVAPRLVIPPELEKDLTVIDVPLPNTADLLMLLKDIARVVTASKRAVVDVSRETAEALVGAAHGLTLSEAENAFAKAVASDNRLDANDVQLLLEEKKQVVRKSGLLEYDAAQTSIASVGGLSNLKQWLARRKNAFSEAARQFGLPQPKGLLLLGVQGCGKSLTARAIANSWRLPLVRLDIGRIYSGLVGSSEENLRQAIRTVEGLAPAVLWVDEIEKGLAGAGSGGGGDTGVSARIFGTLLTWLQEKTAPVFVVATANRVDGLPPELLRKGRFDETFFIDLPTEGERAAILALQLQRRGREPKAYPVAALAQAADDFSGAELEQVVVSGLYDAFADGTELTAEHLHAAISQTKPLAVMMAEDVQRLRAWAATRTRPAS